jgi:lysine-N-methylase
MNAHGSSEARSETGGRAGAAIAAFADVDSTHVMPRYMERFACIGPACTDSCCAAGWRVAVDRATHDRWQTLPVQALRQALRSGVEAMAEAPQHNDDIVGELRHKPNGDCVLLTDERLCSVQAQHGESALPTICDSYPRQFVSAGARTSLYASLGCPEAARLALTDPAALDMVAMRADTPRPRNGPVTARQALATAKLHECSDEALDPVQASAELFATVARRLIAHPSLTAMQAWIHLVGKVHWILASQRFAPGRRDMLESIRSTLCGTAADADLAEHAQRDEHEYFADHPLAERLREAHDAAQTAAKLPGTSPGRKVLAECLQAIEFDTASATPQPTQGGLAQFALAQSQWFEPFDREHPHLLKNYLHNLIGIGGFPAVGLGGIGVAVADIALRLDQLRLFLIGRAALQRQAFGVADYLSTVQAYTRYVVC